MNRITIALGIVLLCLGCKSKNSLVKDYIKGRLAQLDTSAYKFQKIEIVDTLADTIFIKNSEVRQYAKDFLDLPNLSEDDLKDDYTEDHLYDDLQNAFVFVYKAKKNDPIREQHVTVEPEANKEGKNDIRSVYVDYWATEQENVTVRKKMMWQANSFYIITTNEKPGVPEQVKTVKVIWNGFDGGTK